MPNARRAAHALLLEREFVNLMETLVGADASSGVPHIIASKLESISEQESAVSNALLDTLALSYLRAYRGLPPVVTHQPAMEECAHALLRLAVIVMAPYEA